MYYIMLTIMKTMISSWLTSNEKRKVFEALETLEEVLSPYMLKGRDSMVEVKSGNISVDFTEKALEFVRKERTLFIEGVDEYELSSDLEAIKDIIAIKSVLNKLMKSCSTKSIVAEKHAVQKSYEVFSAYKNAASDNVPGAKEKVFKLAQRMPHKPSGRAEIKKLELI